MFYMSENTRSRITITLGDKVVKRAGTPMDGSSGDSPSTVGRKRSVKDRLGGLGDSTARFDKKRLRADGRGFSQPDSDDDMGLRKDDLRFKIMRKSIHSKFNDQQSVSDLRDLLSRPAQSSTASVAARTNIPNGSNARPRFPELGNGKQHMSGMRESMQSISENRNSRQNMADGNDVRPRMEEANSPDIMGKVRSRPEAGALNHVGMLRSSSSPWTLERLRRRSPDVSSRQRSPDVALRSRSPDLGLRQRSPDVASRQRSPDVALRWRSQKAAFGRRSPDEAFGRRSPDVGFGKRSPDVAFGRRSPDVALRRRSPSVALRRRSPDVALRRRSPDVALSRRSPGVALRRRSPGEALRRRSPGEALRRRSPGVALRRRSPGVALRRRSPGVGLRRRSPDIVLSTPRGYSPPRREEELQRGPSMRSHNGKGVGTYMSRDHDFSRPRPSGPYMTTSALPAARAYMNKDVHDISRNRASAPYMTTASIPAVHSKPMILLPAPSMPPSTFTQRSSYVMDDPVGIFLRSLGLEKYWINFKAEEVDIYSLKQMGDNDLKDLGIPMGPRKKIMLALQSRYKRQIP